MMHGNYDQKSRRLWIGDTESNCARKPMRLSSYRNTTTCVLLLLVYAQISRSPKRAIKKSSPSPLTLDLALWIMLNFGHVHLPILFKVLNQRRRSMKQQFSFAWPYGGSVRCKQCSAGLNVSGVSQTFEVWQRVLVEMKEVLPAHCLPCSER